MTKYDDMAEMKNGNVASVRGWAPRVFHQARRRANKYPSGHRCGTELVLAALKTRFGALRDVWGLQPVPPSLAALDALALISWPRLNHTPVRF